MEAEILIALIAKMVDERLEALPLPIAGARGARGFPGHNGQDGKDFVFSEHEGVIRAWAKEFALKFEDLSDDQINSLRGPRGRDGSAGADGRSFIFEENREAIESVIRGVVSDLRDSLRLKFTDLDAEEISQLRGPRGRDGRDFNFEENKDAIEGSIGRAVELRRDDLRLKFSDLDDSEIGAIRGPRGRDGRDGRDFVFEDHLDFFNSLRLKFSDLSEAERETLRLHFAQLTEEEKDSLKLKFSDLSDEDRATLRGPRGLRGQRGTQGRDGVAGSQGPRGLPGITGVRGLPGLDGLDGRDGINGLNGLDAPYITSIDLEQIRDEIIFRFEFSDGTVLRTDPVKLPVSVVSVSSGGGKGGSGVKYDIRIDEPSSSTTYVGETTPGNGASTSAEVWRIKKLSVVGTETIIEYAGGKSEFTNAWDDRATLSYG